MFDPILVNLLYILMLVASGVILGNWLSPVPWKFPGWSKQFVVTKIAGGLAIGSALLLTIGEVVEFLCSK